MSAVSEIGTWANQQADWVSDAVRRLFDRGALDAADIRDMAALLKSSLGMEDVEQRVPLRLDPKDLPGATGDGADIRLTAIRAPTNINALAAADGIAFAEEGLTIVYGYNGAGKSGYGRALKRACRARYSEDIIPNVFASNLPKRVASAVFEWTESGSPASATWTNGEPPPPALSKVAVFDTHCARVFVDDQAKVAYIPYGLDVLRDLAAAQIAAQAALQAELNDGKFDQRKLDPLRGETVVGKAVGAINKKTDPVAFENLATLTEEEFEERLLLVKLLRQDDPAKQAAFIRRMAVRFQAVETELVHLETPFLDLHLAKLRETFVQLEAADKASRLASAAILDEGTALPGTGTEPWEILLHSAILFASQTVYPSEPFPGPDAGASCVLCQQPLSPDASERLKRFYAFLQADAQKLVTRRRALAAELFAPITRTAIDAFPADKAFLDEVTEAHPALVEAIRTYLVALLSRQQALKLSAASRKVAEVAPLPSSPAVLLAELRTKMLAQAELLEKTLTPEQRRLKTARLLDLEARELLKPLLPTVLEAISAAKTEALLLEAIRSCNTTAVTKKTSELYERHVTQALEAALERELVTIGVRGIKFKLEMTGVKGARMQQLRLSTAGHYGKSKLSDILSEGEQRSIALASFLAEISLESDRSTIVFDDPVSSLDHVRAERISLRLAREAKIRQVIIFTHDLAFAWSLIASAKSVGAKHSERHVYTVGTAKGLSRLELPFEGQPLKKRLKPMRDYGLKAKADFEATSNFDAYNDAARNGYRRLRDGWEALVEDVLFGGVVKRFRRSVETTRLRLVTVDDPDVKLVWEGMTRCSSFVHDGGDAAPPVLPSPEEFIEDIESLIAAFEKLSASSEQAEERRKANGLTA